MNKIRSIQIKSAFLLIIFSLNMFVGFACAVGVGMDFSSTHHHEEAVIKAHIHAAGTKHHHEEPKHKHPHNKGKDDCCNDRITKISQTDKAVPQSIKILSPVFFIVFTAAFYNINVSYPSQAYTSNKYFVRGNHPPIPDIRIAIQSFQI